MEERKEEDKLQKNYETSSNKNQLDLTKEKIYYTCKECKGIFPNEEIYHNHLKTHYLCDFCGIGYTSRHALLRHKLKHTNSFVCDICEKKFSKKRTLEQHKINHKENKPYVCDVCGKGFTVVKYLDLHKKYHVFHSTYVICNLCGSEFNDYEEFQNHIKNHNEITLFESIQDQENNIDKKAYKCETCRKKFKFKSSLWKHKKKKHSNENVH